MQRFPSRASLGWALLAPAALLLATSCSSIEVPRAVGSPPRDAKGAFDHKELDAVLRRFVDPSGRVDYGSLRLDHAALDKYLGQLANTSPDNDKSLFPNRWHQLAYWINAYNACALKQVIESNLTETVGSGPIDQASFFRLTKFELGGESHSLNAIEDKAAGLDDARVYFALTFAASGCPRLRPEALAGETCDKVLEEAAKEFCNDARNVDLAKGSASVTLSKLFDWHESAMVAYASARGIANPNLRDAINLWRPNAGKLPINGENLFRDYDWTLNAQKGGAVQNAAAPKK